MNTEGRGQRAQCDATPAKPVLRMKANRERSLTPAQQCEQCEHPRLQGVRATYLLKPRGEIGYPLVRPSRPIPRYLVAKSLGAPFRIVENYRNAAVWKRSIFSSSLDPPLEIVFEYV